MSCIYNLSDTIYKTVIQSRRMKESVFGIIFSSAINRRMGLPMEQALRDFFSKEKDVALAILMGSFAKGTARKDSDVDVALLFSSPPDFTEILDFKYRLSVLLNKEVDLVVLNTAGPVIKMQALKTGVVLYSRDNAYEDFFVRTLNEYDDLKYYRREIEENILRGRLYACAKPGPTIEK